MVALSSLLCVLALSMLITRIATMALVHTGMSQQSARFQARSAFTGAGFTTTESENVVSHPARRRVVMLLMLLGNAGLVTVAATLFMGVTGDESPAWQRITLVVVGVALIWWLATRPKVEAALDRAIDNWLKRIDGQAMSTHENLAHLEKGWRIAEIALDAEHWAAGERLADLRLRDEGLIVLGVRREDERYEGLPHGPTELHTGDTLVLYGQEEAIIALDERGDNAAGDRDHHERKAEVKLERTA